MQARGRTRILITAAAVIAVLLAPSAGATPSNVVQKVASNLPRVVAKASSGTVVANHPSCPRGHNAVLVTGDPRIACVHAAPDFHPRLLLPKQAGLASAKPVCIGNGVDGPRVQAIYAYGGDKPNRELEWRPRIIDKIAPSMEAVFRSTSKAQGREIGIRWHMPNCKLTVDVVKANSDAITPGNPGIQLSGVIKSLKDAGYDQPNRKYAVWIDTHSLGACGVAPGEGLIPVVGSNPTPANYNNVAWQKFNRQVSLTFGTGCSGRGRTGADTDIHELVHLLGAVQLDSPNSNGLGHCTDELDIMCYSEGGVKTKPRCSVVVPVLDCGADDYFNARPQVGSYLSLNWNTANNVFLGEIPTDQVPVNLPRP